MTLRAIIEDEEKKTAVTSLKGMVADRTTTRISKPMKAGDRVRCSSLGRLCVRLEVIRSRMNVEIPDVIGGKTRMTWDIGTAIHDLMQNGVYDRAGVLVGSWICKAELELGDALKAEDPRLAKTLEGRLIICNTVVGSNVKPIQRPDVCPRCRKANTFRYKELSWRHPTLPLSGHTDGLLLFDPTEPLELLEVKSSNDFFFRSARRTGDVGIPYWKQFHGYALLTGVKRGRFVYLNKNDSSEAEIEVDVSERLLEALKTALKTLQKSLSSDRIPLPKRSCKTDDCKRAESCMMREVCFRTSESGEDLQRMWEQHGW